MTSKSITLDGSTKVPLMAVWVVGLVLLGAASVSGAALYRLSAAENRISRLEGRGDRIFVKVTNIQAVVGLLAKKWEVPVPDERETQEDN